jgi:hypothetical protein
MWELELVRTQWSTVNNLPLSEIEPRSPSP